MVYDTTRVTSLMLTESSQAFLGTRPEWTCSGALITCPNGESARVVQTPFMWTDGAWQSELTIHPIEASNGRKSVSMTVRVTPDTLRRWATVGINPFLEACAQLQEHWYRTNRVAQTTLTWL